MPISVRGWSASNAASESIYRQINYGPIAALWLELYFTSVAQTATALQSIYIRFT